MKEERIQKLFNLIESFLPKDAATDFQDFIDESLEMKQMYRYSSDLNEMLRDSVQTLGEKIKKYENEEKELKETNYHLVKERDQALQRKYEIERNYENLRKQQRFLEKEYQSVEKQLKEEKDNFSKTLQKTVKDNEQLLLYVQRLNQTLKNNALSYKVDKEQWEELIHKKEHEIDSLILDNEYLQMECHSYKERLARASQQYGVQIARNHQQQHRKRYRESARPPFIM